MRPRAYEGKEPYIFVSYAHKDDDQVFEILSALGEKEYRVWYDEGITPGSEWTEDIARHLDDSAMVIAFITPASMASKNCRREINYALFKEKPFLSVILEKTEMSPGMMMQLSVQQSILRYDYTSWESFIDKILRCPEIAPCKAPEPVKKTVEEPDKKWAVEEPETINPTGGTEQIPEEPAEIIPAGVKDIGPVKTQKLHVPEKKEKVLKVRYVESAGRNATKPKKTRYLIPVLLGIVGIIAALVILVPRMSNVKTSWGEEYTYNTDSITISDKNITQDDLEGIAGLKKLSSIYFHNVDFSACDFSNIRFASSDWKIVVFSGCKGINNYGFLKEITPWNLSLDGCENFLDMSLINLSSLTNLCLDGTGVTDLSVLAGSKVCSLSFQNTAVSDVSVAAELPYLNEINGAESNVTSLTALADVEGLYSIDFHGCTLTDLPQGMNALSLENVNLSGCGLTDLGILSNCTRLYTLDLSDNPLPQDVSELLERNSETLGELSLSRTGVGIETLESIRSCTNLRSLCISGNTTDNLLFVSGLKKLRLLRAENCGIKDISGLKDLNELTKVLLSFNEIDDVTSLGNSIQPSTSTIIDLSFNKLTSVSSLPDGTYYLLLLHGNDDSIALSLHTGIGTYMISLPWNDGISKNSIKDYGVSNAYLIDCPGAKRLEAEKLFVSCHYVTEEKLMELLHDDKLTYSIGINYDYPFEIYQNR